ncbi:MAG TPA: hypothetical protein VJ032_08085 [Thermoanaerobaculia bacterium]|nr:hypothetical protein [Thermoanaerobaculia bacterium]
MTRAATNIGWLLAAAASAYACFVAVPGTTPIDRALPLVALLVTLLAWSAESMAVQIAVPLLIVAAIAVPDERLRLLTYGVIVAAAFARSLFSAAAIPVAIAGIALLRWIPLDSVVVWREALILVGALLVLRFTRSVPAAVLVAAATPLFPLKALAFPFLIAALAAWLPRRFRVWAVVGFAVLVVFARYSFVPMLVAAAVAMLETEGGLIVRPPGSAVPQSGRTISPPSVLLLLLVVLFPWSGAAIHALPPALLAVVAAIAIVGRVSPIVAAAGGLTLLFCMPAMTTFDRTNVDTALKPSQSLTIDVAPSRRVVVTASGANVSSMRNGVLGTIEALDAKQHVIATRPIAIGDVADWGFMRREHLFASRNRLPRDPSWRLIGYGAESWFTGAGRVTIDAPRHIETLRITADPSLPRIAALQIESVELPRR